MKGSVITSLMVGGALAAGASAAYFANGYMDKAVSVRRAQLDSQYQPVRVVVASADLRPGTLLSGQSVAIREFPRAFLHSEAVLADNWSGVSGRVLARPVHSGEPILQSHLAQDAGAGFSSQLTQGMRALTFPVDEQASIAGMLAPGDHIDIAFTTLARNESITLPLLLNVPVIATGIRTAVNAQYLSDNRQGGQYNTVTVSLTPDDAAKLTLAQDSGKITITLRQPHDESALQIARVTKNTLLNGNRAARSTMAQQPVEIILGRT
ncbi:MAG TPA: Flp pilus assembly protein CpaB [Steroidobacteraceae bacterium]|jgi:pilus assembly protein CpaB